MSKTTSISPFILSPKYIKKHKKCSSDVNENSSNNSIMLSENQYDNFVPNTKEINLLKSEINQYSRDYSLLISELNFWKKIIDKKVGTFLKNIQDFMENDEIKFVTNFSSENANFNDFLKFKKIYYNTFQKIPLDNNNLCKPFMNVHDFSLSKSILNELIASNNDVTNINKFIDSTSKVLCYINNLNKKCQNSLDNFENKNMNKNNNIKLLSVNNYINDDNKSNYTENRIIEKYIDFKDNNNLNQRNKNLSVTLQSFCNITPKNSNNKLNSKKTIENNFESLKTSQSSNTIWKTPKSHYQKNIYLRKSVTPIISTSFCRNFKMENLTNKNESVNLVLDSTKVIEGNKYLNKSCSMKNGIQLNQSLKFLELSTMTKKNNYMDKNKFNSSEKINLNKGIFCSQNNRLIYGKEKEQKTFIHKKFMRSNIATSNLKKNIEKLNIKNHIRANSNLISNFSDKILDIDNLNTNNSYLNNRSKIFLNSITKNDRIKSSIFKLLNQQKEESKINKEKETNCDKLINNPKITKGKHGEKISIDTDFPLYLGIDLGDNDCKLCLLNGIDNEIKLFSFKNNLYNIPTIIYFNKIKEEIKIGYKAENLGIKEPSQIIYNLLKYVGINYDEIIGKKELLPFKIYKSDNNKRPYVKIDFNGQQKKLFYFEDILSLFLQKLFEKLFKKIIIKNKTSNSTIDIFIGISLPNYLSYLQKKIIEKIFYNQIFPENVKYNDYNINLKKINLEISSNIPYLNDIIKIENDSTEKNALIIYTDKCSINLSIVNKNKLIYEVKAIENAAFGEEDLEDNYLCYCIRNLEKTEKIDFLKYQSFLYQLKTKISLAKKNFDIISQKHINLELKDSCDFIDKNIDIILKRDDYEKSCDEFFKKISLLISNIIKKSKISIINFDDIILIGQTAKSLKVKRILSDIFKENKKIIELLNSNSNNKEIDKEYLTVIGCVIQSINNNNLLKNKYFFVDICPSSFGVETIDGMMEIILDKGTILPFKNKKLVKINNNKENICINIFEGEDRFVKNNKFIVSANIDKFNLGKNIGKKFIELYIQLEIDIDNNLKCFIHEPNSKNRYECLININVVKN